MAPALQFKLSMLRPIIANPVARRPGSSHRPSGPGPPIAFDAER
jgi:hypothetical protein